MLDRPGFTRVLLSALLLGSCRIGYEQLPLSAELGLGGSQGTAASGNVATGGSNSSIAGGDGAGAPASGGSALDSGGAGPEPQAGGAGPEPGSAGATQTGAGGAGACSETNGGVEACDGLDNDCNGLVDETNPCAAGCFADARDGTGYMLCSNVLSAPDAQAYCAQSGMNLIRIDDAAENEFVRATAFGDANIAARPFFFLGGGDAATEGVWLWQNGDQFWSGGTTGMPVGGRYQNFLVGEPNDKGGSGEDCLGMAAAGGWADIRCVGLGTAEMPFGCERN